MTSQVGHYDIIIPTYEILCIGASTERLVINSEGFHLSVAVGNH